MLYILFLFQLAFKFKETKQFFYIFVGINLT